MTNLCRDGKMSFIDEQRIYVCMHSDHIYFAFLFVLFWLCNIHTTDNKTALINGLDEQEQH